MGVQGQYAFEPDPDELEPYEEILDAVAKMQFEPSAASGLAYTYVLGYTRAMLEPASFPVSLAAREIDTPGILESAVALQILGTLAEGIAIGRGHSAISKDDVQTARDRLCDEWPDCLEMRVQATSFGVQRLMRKLRGGG